jgi:hypothetical protein
MFRDRPGFFQCTTECNRDGHAYRKTSAEGRSTLKEKLDETAPRDTGAIVGHDLVYQLAQGAPVTVPHKFPIDAKSFASARPPLR